MKKFIATLSVVFFLAIMAAPVTNASVISVNDATIVKVADEEPKKDEKKSKKDAKKCAETKEKKACGEKKPCSEKKSCSDKK